MVIIKSAERKLHPSIFQNF